MKKLLLKFFILFLLVGAQADSFAFGTSIKAGILVDSKISSLSLFPLSKSYFLRCDSNEVLFLNRNDKIDISSNGNTLNLSINKHNKGNFKELELFSIDSCTFKLKVNSPDLSPRFYDGNLHLSSVENVLKLINIVNFDNYIAGVIESEAGLHLPLEYYKVQAIICRTYALTNIGRHDIEGVDVCDKVHCQVYRGKSKAEPKILAAAFSTRNMVLVDHKPELITAAFHSNCGGQTCNSEDVWNQPRSYLKATVDSFCVGQRNALWTKEIPKETWLNYLNTSRNYPYFDSLNCALVKEFEFNERPNFIAVQDKALLTKNIRNEFKLKSAYFSVCESDQQVTLYGKGYGHGVGLCQEGAIQMAKRGYSYSSILHFYYRDINIVNLHQLGFFKSDELMYDDLNN